MTYNGIRVDVNDVNIVTVTMCNGDNKFNMEYLQTWHKVIDDIQKNPDIKGLITTGEGKAFSTGLDLDWLRQSDPNILDVYHDELHRLYRRVMSLGIPTVAAINDWLRQSDPNTLDVYHDELHRLYRRVMSLGITTVAVINGHAIAEGAFLALVHDYRIMRTDRGWINWPEVHVKLPFTRTMLDIVRLKMPSSIAQWEAIIFGKRLDAMTARTLGIVDACVPEEQLMQTALQTVQNALGKYQVDKTFFQIMKEDVYDNCVTNEQLSRSKL